jgi:hypothetical protein
MPKLCALGTLHGLVRRPRGLVVGGCVAFLCLAPVLWGQKQEAPRENFGLLRRGRFEGSVKLRTKAGRATQVGAVLHQWSIPGKQRVAIPEHGFLLVELRAGRLTTTIDGKELERRAGDFWTVPAKVRMWVTVTSESAVLDVMSLDFP